MKFEAVCFECCKKFDYTAMSLEVKNRNVKCPHCNNEQVRHPAWDKPIVDARSITSFIIT